MIALILSHDSALAYWSSPLTLPPRTTLDAAQAQAALETTKGAIHTALLSEALQHEPLVNLPLPLDLLVTLRDDRRKTQKAQLRCLQTQLPDAALAPYEHETGEGYQVMLSTPEFCFVQMASALSEAELVELGFEFCGSYALSSQADKGYVSRRPVATPQSLLDFSTLAEGMTGAKKARKAAKVLLAGARNPKESEIAMLACLPRSMGGFGTPAPLLNHVIEAPDEATRLLGSRTFTPALYWPSIKTAVEYDRRTWHNEEARVEYNMRKANACKMMGIELIAIGREDFADLDKMRVTFETVSSRLGKRRKPVNERQEKRQEKLHARLVAGTHRACPNTGR